MNRSISSYCALLCLTTSLFGCVTDSKTPQPITMTVPAPQLGWRLPKTVLDTTVTWTPKEACQIKDGGPLVTADVSVTVAARGVADPDIGKTFPNGLITVSTGDLKSFWIDSNLTYKIFAGRGGLLQTLSSHSTGETGPIIGNFLTGITKIVAAAVAAPSGKTYTGNVCGTADDVLVQIDKLRKQLKTANTKSAQDLATQIQNLKDSITVTTKKTIDPGVDPFQIQDGVVAFLAPDPAGVVRAGWYGNGAGAVNVPPETLKVKIRFDLEHATLCPACGAGVKTIARTEVPKGALFRQAAYIPVYAEHGPFDTQANDPGRGIPLGDTQIIAFGQFGAAASLPIKAKSFQDINWEVDFSELGEVTQTTFASKATGVAMSTLFSGAATSASAIQSSLATAAAAPDSATAALTKENTALKAQIDNKNYKTQLEALGTPTSASPSP